MGIFIDLPQLIHTIFFIFNIISYLLLTKLTTAPITQSQIIFPLSNRFRLKSQDREDRDPGAVNNCAPKVRIGKAILICRIISAVFMI